jgi:hypothetical protein
MRGLVSSFADNRVISLTLRVREDRNPSLRLKNGSVQDDNLIQDET